MSTATIVIGIGSTGLRIIEQAEQFHYELTGQNKPGRNVEYLFLETDISARPRRNASGETEIQPVLLNSGNYRADLQLFEDRSDIDSSWIPTHVMLQDDGAGGQPALGRLALWVNGNYRVFQNRLAESIGRVLMGNPQQKLQVLVVGTLTGGTGSGICVDIAYLVRQRLGGANSQVNGIFLLPGRDDMESLLPMCRNSFSALSALQAYSKDVTRYSSFCSGLSGPLNENQNAPYDLITLLSPEFSTGMPQRIPARDISELIRVAGSLVALNFLDTIAEPMQRFYAKIEAKRIDARHHEGMGRFATAGFHMIQFPKSQLEELLAIEKVEELLRDLGQGGVNDPLLPEIISATKDKFESALERASETVVNTPVEGRTVMDYLLGKWEENKTLRGPVNRFLYDLFCIATPPNPNNVTHRLMSHLPSVRENFIRQLHDHVEDIIQVHGRLNFAEAVVRQFETSKREHLDWAEGLGVPADPERWNHALQLRIEGLTSKMSLYSTLGLEKQYRSYVLEELIWTVKQHTLSQVLKELNFAEVNADDARWYYLPTLSKIESFRNTVLNLVQGEQMNASGEIISFPRRSGEINSILRDDHRCFTYLYARGSKENDLEAGRATYSGRGLAPLRAVDLFPTETIWSTLMSRSSKEIFETTLMSAFKHVKVRNVFNEINLVDIIKGPLPTMTREKIAQLIRLDEQIPLPQIPAMVSLQNNVNFGPHAHVQTWVCSSNPNEFAGLIPNKENARVELPSLNNSIVLYYEYGCMLNNELFSPIQHLAIMPRLKENIRREIASGNGKNFRIMKFPYLSEQEVNQYLA